MANGEGAARFPLSDSSTLVIQMGDITKWFVDGSTDAIVNLLNLSLSLSLSVNFSFGLHHLYRLL